MAREKYRQINIFVNPEADDIVKEYAESLDVDINSAYLHLIQLGLEVESKSLDGYDVFIINEDGEKHLIAPAGGTFNKS